MTRLAVIGRPVAHSLSPALFAAIAATTGRALSYERIEIAPDDVAERLAAAAADRAFHGWNVTLPHKERVAALVDRLDPAAAAVGAVNVVRFADDGTTYGWNTDVAGVALVLDLHGIARTGRDVAIFGTGGAARAVAAAAAQRGAARVTFVSREAARADGLAVAFGRLFPACAFAGTTTLADASRYAFFANATPLGMQGYEQANPLPADAPTGAWAFDCVYRPERTPFLIAAEAQGLRVASGIDMLVGQAMEAYRLWFGESVCEPHDPAYAALVAAVRKAL